MQLAVAMGSRPPCGSTAGVSRRAGSKRAVSRRDNAVCVAGKCVSGRLVVIC